MPKIHCADELVILERVLAHCNYNFCQREPIINTEAYLIPAILISEFLSVRGVGIGGGGPRQDP